MPQYRIELSPNARAGCKDTVCKANATKIAKGEIRFGTWVEIQDHGSWGWKHWGCVSGAQLLNIKEACDQGEGNFDFDLIDGFDELGDHPEIQEKIRRCVRQAHIDPEDFNGDPEKNKPGVKGIHLTAKQKADKEKEAAGGDSEDEAPKKKGAKRGRKKADPDEEEDDEPVAKKAKTSKAAKAAPKATPKAARGKASAKKPVDKDETDSALTESGEEDASEPESPVKKAGKAKAKAAPAKAKAPAKGRGKAKAKASSDEGDVVDSDDEPLPAAKSKAAAKVKAPAAGQAKPRRGRPRKT
ncbi:hypothetical protein HIM_05747 [Hirsutella minnesotensis 3608]|uniref:PARP-type domain-containing protein n=1 Tax=Hirsutella minnesotensis 3608 TaxID=1043627 RepID=A0A0F7ZUG8_9HYPO|nr:hypothetical protein HIM_05747 [Hirsutella minnesotensis 3608]